MKRTLRHAEIGVEHKLRLMTKAIVVLIALFVPLRGVACTMSFAQHKVGRDFVIEISYNGHPLEGIEAEISRETPQEPYLSVVASTRTNASGESSIKELAPGSYFLVVRHAGVDGEAVELKVVGQEQSDASIEGRLKLNWPYRKVFKVRQIAGTLLRAPFDNTQHSAETPLAGAMLTLTDALPATKRSVSVVQDDGRFVFANLDSGLYILHVKQVKGTQTIRPIRRRN